MKNRIKILEDKIDDVSKKQEEQIILSNSFRKC